jgi:hypothetical protein
MAHPTKRIITKWADLPRKVRNQVIFELHKRRHAALVGKDKIPEEVWSAAIDALDPPSEK